jgi:transposase
VLLAAVATGHDESAGKRRSGNTRWGHRARRTGLTPLAPAAARTTGTSRSALYQRLAPLRGRERAIMAGAPALVVSTFHLLSRHAPDRERGANSGDEPRPNDLVNHVTRRMERLG